MVVAAAKTMSLKTWSANQISSGTSPSWPLPPSKKMVGTRKDVGTLRTSALYYRIYSKLNIVINPRGVVVLACYCKKKKEIVAP